MGLYLVYPASGYGATPLNAGVVQHHPKGLRTQDMGVEFHIKCDYSHYRL